MSNVLGGVRQFDEGTPWSGSCHARAAAQILGGLKRKPPKPVPANTRRLLRIAWQTELSAEVVNELDDDLLRRVAAQTLPVQAYYAVFNVARAATGAAGTPCETHAAVHRDWGTQRVKTAFGSWGVALAGDPEDLASCTLTPKIVAPYGFNPMEQSHADEAYVWTALRMTRRWKVDAARTEWLRNNKKRDGTPRKQLPRVERVKLCDALRPTTLMDFLYELRCRTNYRGVEEYGSDADDDAVRTFHSSLLHVADLGMLHYEALLARSVGFATYARQAGEWSNDVAKVGSWATRRVERRLEAIRAEMGPVQ